MYTTHNPKKNTDEIIWFPDFPPSSPPSFRRRTYSATEPTNASATWAISNNNNNNNDLYTESGQTLKGSFSAVSKPNFESKSSLESSRRDLHNALLCTVLVGSVWVKKYTKINTEKRKSGKS